MKNFLLITVDAFGADKCWDLDNVKLEFLDTFAKRGVRFTNFFSSTSSTTPSLATVQTGLYPKEHGIISTYGHTLFDNVSTLAEVFKDQGYRTYASVGGPLGQSTGLDRGFDKYWFHSPEMRLSFFKWGVLKKRIRYNNYLMKKERKEVFESDVPWFYWTHLLDVHNRWRIKPKIQDENLTDYEKAVIELDHKLEDIIESVDLENTTVVISADHGHYVSGLDVKIPKIEYPEAHGFGTNDILTNVPLIIVDKDLKQGTTCDKIVASVDLMPTIIDFMGFKSSYTGHGTSFKTLLVEDNETFIEKPILLAANGAILRRQGLPFLYALRKDGWKLVMGQDKTRFASELYDLENDPSELNNIYEISLPKAYEMEQELDEMIRRVQDGS